MLDVIICPDEISHFISVQLPNPKSLEPQTYYYDEESSRLYESVQFHDKFRSWFLGNHFCSKGHFNILTKLDPIHMFLPQLIRYANEKFRSIDDICATYSDDEQIKSPNTRTDKLEYALSPGTKWDLVCDIKHLDEVMYLKFNESKTLDWLSTKHQKVMVALREVLTEDHEPSTATLMSYAFDLIDLYVPQSLSEKFKSRIKISSIAQSDGRPTDSAAKATGSKPIAKSRDNKRPSDTRPRQSAESSLGIMKYFKKGS